MYLFWEFRTGESFVRLGFIFPYAIVERKDTIKLAVNKCFSSQILRRRSSSKESYSEVGWRRRARGGGG